MFQSYLGLLNLVAILYFVNNAVRTIYKTKIDDPINAEVKSTYLFVDNQFSSSKSVYCLLNLNCLSTGICVVSFARINLTKFSKLYKTVILVSVVKMDIISNVYSKRCAGIFSCFSGISYKHTCCHFK